MKEKQRSFEDKSKVYRSNQGGEVRAIDKENMTITHKINTKELDRYLTFVLPLGARIKNFLKNPTVLWLHNHDNNPAKIPIAKCLKLRQEVDFIEATTQFNEKDPLAVKVFQAYEDGFLNAWSIGFMPEKYKRYSEENREDLNKAYGLDVTEEQIKDAGFWGIFVITEWELFEYSAVPVPGNPGCLTSEEDKVEFEKQLAARGLMPTPQEAIRQAEGISPEENPNQEPNEQTETVPENTDESAAPKVTEQEVPEATTAKTDETEEPRETPTEETEDAQAKEAEEQAAREAEEEKEKRLRNIEETQLLILDVQQAISQLLIKFTGESQKNLKDLIEKLQAKSEADSKKLEDVTKVLTVLAEAVSEVEKSLQVDNIEALRQIEENKDKSDKRAAWINGLFKNAK